MPFYVNIALQRVNCINTHEVCTCTFIALRLMYMQLEFISTPAKLLQRLESLITKCVHIIQQVLKSEYAQKYLALPYLGKKILPSKTVHGTVS